MRHHGSTTEKHVGDAVITVWTHGAKGQEPIEILRILRAVEEIARVTTMLDQSFILAEPLRIGAGVYTGPAAVASNTGRRAVSDFTTLGDGVNAALTLEAVAKEMETDLVLGASTLDCVRTWPAAVRHFGSCETKLTGCDAPVKIWYISLRKLSKFLAEHHEDLVKATTGRTYPADRPPAARTDFPNVAYQWRPRVAAGESSERCQRVAAGAGAPTSPAWQSLFSISALRQLSG